MEKERSRRRGTGKEVRRKREKAAPNIKPKRLNCPVILTLKHVESLQKCVSEDERINFDGSFNTLNYTYIQTAFKYLYFSLPIFNAPTEVQVALIHPTEKLSPFSVK